jgi:hypothetical protein
MVFRFGGQARHNLRLFLERLPKDGLLLPVQYAGHGQDLRILGPSSAQFWQGLRKTSFKSR